jgi:3-deoxy-D-manno-octulosonic acid kinase
MPLERIPTETGAILYEPSRIDHPLAADFEVEALVRAGRLERRGRGRGSVWFVRAARAPGSWVLRHYRRGGLVARVCGDRYWWRGEETTRPFRELRLLAEIESLDLPAVRPVAARYARGAFGYRADLLTVAVPQARTLAALLVTEPPLELWARVGATIRAFHDAGVYHADLNAHNVLVGGDGGVLLLDFDRGELRAPGRWTERNLARLARSLTKLSAAGHGRFPADTWAALRDGYAAPRRAPPR